MFKLILVLQFILLLFNLINFTGFIYPNCYNRKPKKSRKKIKNKMLIFWGLNFFLSPKNYHYLR